MEYECPGNGTPVIPEELADITAKHPCYSFDAHHQFARMHLPVAPVCNIRCNYCNRKYDCVNESRPGVTSAILTPEAARDRFVRAKRAIPDLSVAGIAGPGDALANWEQVRRSIILIKKEAPECILCLSTNGLKLPHYGPEIVALGIKHVTVTVNCIDPVIGAAIYHHLEYQGERYTGEIAAEILMNNQMEGIQYLAENGTLVKINIVMIPGVNAGHIPVVVKRVKKLGAFLANIMPLIPAAGSAFETLPRASMSDIQAMREICRADIGQICHCQQCRADAIGRLTEDLSHQFWGNKEESKALTAKNTVEEELAVV
jgi:nitrogen fixation protein NifB